MQFSKLLDILGSLRLTVICLFVGMLLVFFGTLAQVNHGIFTIQKQYFQSLVVWWGPAQAGWKIPVLPGGYLIGGLMVINLIAAQIRTFQLSAGRIGLYLVHLGMILLLLGQLATDFFQVESHMRLSEGQASDYSESSMLNELAVVSLSQTNEDTVTAIPESLLNPQALIRHPSLPFQIKVLNYYQNSRLANRAANAPGQPPAMQGLGRTLEVAPEKPATRTDERNLPTAIIEIITPAGSLGVWLVSTMLTEPQRLTAADKTWELIMRPKRFYKPYRIALIDFTHEKYPGTEIPKNFSSRVKVFNPAGKEAPREVLIYMNNPLRYGGETYYQSSYDPNDERVSILQVVRNPSWLTPYIACLLVGAGLTLHFMINLIGFVRKVGKGGEA